MIITSYINRGNSFPVILENKGQSYFVKLRAGMSGKYGLVSEWIGNKLGRHLHIKTQNPIWLELKHGIEKNDLHIEVRELIAKSLGTNIGFKFLKNSTELKLADLNLLGKKEAIEIYLFDLMMLNIDRTPKNMNLMNIGNEFISVDYESSLLCTELIEQKNLLSDTRILQCLKRNPLYEEINEETIIEFTSRVNAVLIKNIIAEVPLTLLSKEERKLFMEGIEYKIRNNWFLTEIMEKLKEVTIETEEVRKIRMSKNQDDFIRHLKSNSGHSIN